MPFVINCLGKFRNMIYGKPSGIELTNQVIISYDACDR